MKKSSSDKTRGELVVPSLLRVFLAYAIDWYIVAFISALPVYLLRSIHLGTMSLVNQTADLPDVYIIAAMIIGIIITLTYFVVLPLKPTGKRQAGQTLGKRILKIKTIHVDGTDIQFKESLLRNLYIFVLEGSIFPSFLYIREALSNMTSMDVNTFFNIYTIIALASVLISFFNQQRRAGHDLFSKTRIVKCASS